MKCADTEPLQKKFRKRNLFRFALMLLHAPKTLEDLRLEFFRSSFFTRTFDSFSQHDTHTVFI